MTQFKQTLVPLLVYGEISYPEDIVNMIEKYQIDENTEFRGKKGTSFTVKDVNDYHGKKGLFQLTEGQWYNLKKYETAGGLVDSPVRDIFFKNVHVKIIDVWSYSVVHEKHFSSEIFENVPNHFPCTKGNYMLSLHYGTSSFEKGPLADFLSLVSQNTIVIKECSLPYIKNVFLEIISEFNKTEKENLSLKELSFNKENETATTNIIGRITIGRILGETKISVPFTIISPKVF